MNSSDVISIKGQVFETLVAVTESEQCKGLMYQKWPPPIMAFPYKRAATRRFWMKNVITPLDIIFCRANCIVGIFKGEPFSTELVGPNEPSDLVVELPGGTAAKLGLVVGDYVGFSPTKNTAERQRKYGVSF
jgi:uncharacterized membrane protein (UPF0127 family)